MLDDHGDATEVLSVRSRPVRNPIFLGLSTAAILAAGASTSALADSTPTPSPSGTDGSSTPTASTTPTASNTPTASPPGGATDTGGSPSPSPTGSQTGESGSTPTPTPTQRRLHGEVAATSSRSVLPGQSVAASVHVYSVPDATSHVTLKLATSKKTSIAATCTRITGGCDLGLLNEIGKRIPVTITIPNGTAAGNIRFSATATASGATSWKETFDITVKKPAANTTRATTDTGGAGGGTGSGGTAGGAPTNPGALAPGSGAAYVPPSATGALAPATAGAPPSAQFPQIAPQQPGANPPMVAGAGSAQNMGALRAASPEPQELTFQRLASTQAAWLAALLVAFSLLLTQVRMNRPADARRRRGAHRRRRSGVFQA
jgi:hypothetical protein